jgi:hypothetical protein
MANVLLILNFHKRLRQFINKQHLIIHIVFPEATAECINKQHLTIHLVFPEAVATVRYHCGGWPEEVNSCFLNSYMVYL